MTNVANPLKIAFRKRFKEEILNTITADSRKKQSEAITKNILASEPFKNAQRISVYLSTATEVSTIRLLAEMFKHGKQVFVPTYSKDTMEMVKLNDMHDYESLELTKWKIKQPNISDGRENALTTTGIDLFLVPGVAFTLRGGRMGHGMGYYDKYFKRHSQSFPEKQTILMGLAFKEQLVADSDLPLDQNDVKLDYVVTQDDIYEA